MRRELQRVTAATAQDYFALLEVARRPWVDPEELKDHFHRISAASHPDRFHEADPASREAAESRYLELNTAWQCLREPKERLAHLLELETGARPKQVQNIPPGVMELFSAIGPVIRGIDQHLTEKARATSPLLQVQLMQRGMEWTGRCLDLQQSLSMRREELLNQLRKLNGAWEMVEGVEGQQRRDWLPLADVERIQQTLAYLTRWAAQLDERVTELAV